MELPSTPTPDAIDDLLARCLLVFAKRGDQVQREQQENENRADAGEAERDSRRDSTTQERAVVHE